MRIKYFSILMLAMAFSSIVKAEIPVVVSFQVVDKGLQTEAIKRDDLTKMLRKALLVSWTALDKKYEKPFELGIAMSLSGPDGKPIVGHGKTHTWTFEEMWAGKAPAGKVMVINGIFEEPLRKIDFPEEAHYVGLSYPQTDVFDSDALRSMEIPEKLGRAGGPFWSVTAWAYPIEHGVPCDQCVVTLYFSEAR